VYLNMQTTAGAFIARETCPWSRESSFSAQLQSRQPSPSVGRTSAFPEGPVVKSVTTHARVRAELKLSTVVPMQAGDSGRETHGAADTQGRQTPKVARAGCNTLQGRAKARTLQEGADDLRSTHQDAHTPTPEQGRRTHTCISGSSMARLLMAAYTSHKIAVCLAATSTQSLRHTFSLIKSPPLPPPPTAGYPVVPHMTPALTFQKFYHRPACPRSSR